MLTNEPLLILELLINLAKKYFKTLEKTEKKLKAY